MERSIAQLLQLESFTKSEIVELLSSDGEDKVQLFKKSAAVKEKYVKNKVYFRGLIEFSNICEKNCFYCGIRKTNMHVRRYNLSDDEILHAAKFAFDNNYGSIVLQSGEIQSPVFTKRIENLLKKIARFSGNKLRVTLSLGEQSYKTYRQWFESGAHRYLLRIESSNPELYKKLHPNDELHRFERRLESLKILKDIGYQTGTGVMIGLPFQTLENLADDLLFMKNFSIDMVGMGPYIEHADTPLFQYRQMLLPKEERFQLALKMIAILRIMMKDINIASATALQAIDKLGREKAIKIGANVIMPNVTPGYYRDDYALYENKPCTDENPEDCISCLEARIALSLNKIGFGEWGDSAHYNNRMGKTETNQDI
ncbi:MAG: [FeFe] hydrogenase H-cluster radical SAM maturase HydE [Bacteroidales bacterium]|nr:[FeFe] hydrogenase H-cluster radical SAM maturase HydE [Bacteroidales bacterium]